MASLTAQDAQINELIKQNAALTKSLLERTPSAASDGCSLGGPSCNAPSAA